MSDLKTAMKAGEQSRVDTLRFVLSGLNNFKKEKQIKDPASTITDEEVVSLLQKEVKRRKESIELFQQGNRADLVEKEEADLAFIKPYIPAALTTAELEKMVDDAMATGATDFNGVMKEVMKNVKGRADGKAVGDVIKKKLGA